MCGLVAEYECGFPVHQDGSCNGLQHYAALGGDGAGAAAVNLAPRARPQDVYSEVAALVSPSLYIKCIVGTYSYSTNPGKKWKCEKL